MKPRDRLAKIFNPSTWGGYKAYPTYKYAGPNLIQEVNALDPDLVVDVGCGHNRFKGHIQNLIGFDQEPFPFADMHCPIEEANFRPESVDVALCLGSVQFYNREWVSEQVAKIVSWIKPGGYIVMRVRHSATESATNDVHYIWTDEDIQEFTKQHSLEIVGGVQVDETESHYGQFSTNRVVWWWKKPGDLKRYKIDPVTCDITER